MIRILLDENVNIRVKQLLANFDVKTVYDLGIDQLTNGELLAYARDNSDVFLTHDRGIPFQHNHRNQKLIILVLASSSTSLKDVEPLLPKAVSWLREATAGQVATLTSADIVVHF